MAVLTGAPWTFEEAQEWSAEGSRAQEGVEDEVREASRAAADAEREYRRALALKIVELHDEDKRAWSVCGDLARGDERVADLKHARDIAAGNFKAAQQAAWRRSADRRDTETLIEWSMRRDLAEGNGRQYQPAGHTHGARA